MRTSIVSPECGWTASAEQVTGISPSYGNEAETYAVSEARKKKKKKHSIAEFYTASYQHLFLPLLLLQLTTPDFDKRCIGCLCHCATRIFETRLKVMRC